MKKVHSILIFIVLVPLSVFAENSKFTPSELFTFSGRRVIDTGMPTTFLVGKEVAFPKAPTFVAREEISVRLFALPNGSDMPTIWARFEPCLVYWSSLYRVDVKTGVIKLFTIGPDWLAADNAGEVGRRRYLMVFEKGVGDGHTIIRIHKDNVESYFSQGIVLVIAPERSYSVSEGRAMAARQLENTNEAMKIAAQNTPRHRCYAVKPTVLADSSLPTDAAENELTVYAMNECESQIPIP
jgi:hypothetical protein